MKVKFLPSGDEFEIKEGQSILDVAKDNGVHIKSVCGGTPSCAECKVQIAKGEHNILPPSDKEISLIGTAHFVDHSRLSCQMRCFGDIEVDLTQQIENSASGASAKKPRGKAQKADGEESHAVEGSILLGGADLEIFGREVGTDRTNERKAVQVFDEDETRRELERLRRARERKLAKESDDQADDEFLRKLKRRNQKNQEGIVDLENEGEYIERDDEKSSDGKNRKHKKHAKGGQAHRQNRPQSSGNRNRNPKANNNNNNKKQAGAQENVKPTAKKKNFKPKARPQKNKNQT